MSNAPSQDLEPARAFIDRVAVGPIRAGSQSVTLVRKAAAKPTSDYSWQTLDMLTSRADRRNASANRAAELFGTRADAALDALELLELAWHDCYGESSPPEQVIEDIWVMSDGDLGRLIAAARLAVIDFRDLRLNADARREAR
jgi:ABC-type molybdate transport system substrate-binding protein